MSSTPTIPDSQTAQISPLGANTAAVAPLGQQMPATPSPAPANANPTPPPAAGQPSVWKDLAMGALWGLVGAGKSGAMGRGVKDPFAAGLAGGAAGVMEEEPAFKAQQAQAAADVKFKSAQAADMQIDYAYKEKQLNNLPQEQQDAHAKNSLDQLATLKSMGLTPVAVTGDNPGDAQATGRNLTKTQGGVPPLYTIDVGNQHVSFDLGQVAGSPQGLQLLNRQRVDMGQSALSPQEYAAAYPKPADQISAMHTAMDFAHPVIVDQKSLDDAKARLNTIQGQKNITPEMQEDIDSLQQSIAVGEKSVKEANDAANKQAADKATAAKNAEAATPSGKVELEKTQQDILNAKYSNADKHQTALMTYGKDPETGETLNLSNAPDEMLIDSRTNQPIPTKELTTLGPSMQEKNRYDFASSALHTLDQIDQLKQSGKLPNGPLAGITTQNLIKAGMASKDAQEAYNFIHLAQTATTGAHVGGRFNQDIMKSMGSLLTMNMNDQQFQGAEDSIRKVMGQYAQTGGRETVGMYKARIMGQTKVINGQTMKVTGFDKNGNVLLGPQ